MKKLFTILILIALILSIVVAFAASNNTPLPPDLSITTTDGDMLTLSSLLEVKDLVLLNILKSWQSNSRAELAAIEDAYEDLPEAVKIVAVTDEPTVSLATLASYKADLGLSFAMGYTTSLSDWSTDNKTSATTIIIDKAGGHHLRPERQFTNPSQVRDVVDYLLSSAGGEAASYNVLVRDSQNQPVAGVVMNFYTGSTNRTGVSDSNGVISFVGTPEVYHMQIVSAPEGYDRNYEGTCDSSGSWIKVEV